jgi:capsular exopolysaccharide synthesis family protein
MVASALKGEGKTSLASHLATSLARARRRTLLIDCDLRSPAIHRMFDVLSEPGVCEILRGQAALADAIQPTIAEGLSIIPAGRCDSQAIQALAQGNLGSIFDELKQQYDYIVVDTAPVLPVADSLQVCQHVDAVLFSVLRDVSRLPKVYAAYERLATLGVRMLGAVVAGTRCEHYASSYAYNMPQPTEA